MTVLLLNQLVPLLGLIGLGYVAGRWLQVQSHTLAMIAIYFLSPIVNFGGVAQLKFQATYLLLPLLLFVIPTALSFLSHRISGHLYQDNTRNLIAMSSATGNSGYFGTPLALALLGPESVGIYFLMNFGVALCESTVGYYHGARGQFSVGDSLRKVLKLPFIYAVLLGLLWNASGAPLPAVFLSWWERFTGAWVIVGMMLIGVALGQTGRWRANLQLTSVLFAIKFLAWPACTFGLALLDRAFLGLFDSNVHTLLLIIGVVPLAGNTVAFATQLHLRPGEMAALVLESTVFAVFYIPLVFFLLQGFL